MAGIPNKMIVGTTFLVLAVGLSGARGERSRKPNVSPYLSILGFTLEKSTFSEIRDKLGPASAGQCTYDVEPVRYIGYVSHGPDGTKILFESSKFDPPFLLSGFRVIGGNRPIAPCHVECRPTAAFGRDVETPGGLRLGLTKTELIALLGSPAEVRGNRLTFEWWSKSAMTKAEIDDLTKTFKAPVTSPYWDVHDTINVKLSGSQIVDFEVQETATY